MGLAGSRLRGATSTPDLALGKCRSLLVFRELRSGILFTAFPYRIGVSWRTEDGHTINNLMSHQQPDDSNEQTPHVVSDRTIESYKSVRFPSQT